MLLPATRQIDRDIILAARVMGANPWTVFRKAYWPQIMHATLAAWLLTFIISMGFFVTPALLGGTREIFMVMLIESELHSFNISWAATDSLILMLTMALAAGLVVRLTDLPFNRLVGGATK
jgi:ABC-type spermidine/putrescine transport system permease subunit I